MPSGCRPGGQHRQRLRQAARVGEEHAAAYRAARRARVIASAAAVASSSSEAPATGKAGQVLDHGLEVQQRFQPALGDLRLVRRVGRVPAGVLQDVAADHGRGDGPVVAEADHGRQHLVLRRPDPAQLGAAPPARIAAGGRPARPPSPASAGPRQRRGGQLVQRGVPERGEHVRLLGRRMGPMCRDAKSMRASRGEPPGAVSPSVATPRGRTKTPEPPVPSGP